VATVDTKTTSSARSMRWVRRRRALRGFVTTYRKSTMGMIGLAIMIIFIGMALFGPLLVDKARLSVSTPPGTPFQPPSAEFPLGTDNWGRSVLDLIIRCWRLIRSTRMATSITHLVIFVPRERAGGLPTSRPLR